MLIVSYVYVLYFLHSIKDLNMIVFKWDSNKETEARKDASVHQYVAVSSESLI